MKRRAEHKLGFIDENAVEKHLLRLVVLRPDKPKDTDASLARDHTIFFALNAVGDILPVVHMSQAMDLVVRQGNLDALLSLLPLRCHLQQPVEDSVHYVLDAVHFSELD